MAEKEVVDLMAALEKSVADAKARRRVREQEVAAKKKED